jgi:hypothetical protein
MHLEKPKRLIIWNGGSSKHHQYTNNRKLILGKRNNIQACALALTVLTITKLSILIIKKLWN